MCEQQRCISVQRSIHRVEVNARPYSGPRKEREGSEGLGGVRGAWRSGKGDRGQALSGKNEQTFRKTRKGTWSVPTPPLHPSPPTFIFPHCFALTFMLIDELRFMLDLNASVGLYRNPFPASVRVGCFQYLMARLNTW